MNWVLDPIFGRRVRRETRRYVRELANSPRSAARKRERALIAQLQCKTGAKIALGETLAGDSVEAPLEDIVKSYGLITGGTGSGKSMFALGLIEDVIQALDRSPVGFAVLDAKGDLFQGTLFLLKRKLEQLSLHDPKAAGELQRRVVIYDFASRDPLSSYNILARWPNADDDFFALNRADLLLDLIPGSDKLSLGGVAVLQKALMLLAEFSLPATYLDETLSDDAFRHRLLARSKNSTLKNYFARQFPAAPKSTISALRRRAEALFSSEGVRLALSGKTAPDFRQLQDDGKIVLINCFGETIARSVRRMLQALVLSDIRQSVFARRNRNRPYLWFCDEAQNFFLTESLRDNMSDLLTMSRSFGSFFLYLTQNLGTAVHDTRVLRVLHTNIRWSFSMRGEPNDCSFLKPALPVTGRKPHPRISPFDEQRFHTLSEERAMALDEIAHLPDRVGYLWFKSRSPEALKIRTRALKMPHGPEVETAISSILRDSGFGSRMSRQQYDGLIADRDEEWKRLPPRLDETLREVYRQGRGAPS